MPDRSKELLEEFLKREPDTVVVEEEIDTLEVARKDPERFRKAFNKTCRRMETSFGGFVIGDFLFPWRWAETRRRLRAISR